MSPNLGILKQLLISSHKKNSNSYKYTCNLNGLEVAISIPMDKVEEVLANLVCDTLAGGVNNQNAEQIANSPLQGLTPNASTHAPGDSVLTNTVAQKTSYSPSVNNLVSRADNQHAMQTTGETAQSATLQETQSVAQKTSSFQNGNNLVGSTDKQTAETKQENNKGAEKRPQNKINKQVQDALAKRLDELSVVAIQSQIQDIKEDNNTVSHSNTKVSTIVNTNYPTTVSDDNQLTMQVISDDKQAISKGTQTPTLKPIEEEQTQTQQNTELTDKTTVGENKKSQEDDESTTPNNLKSDGGRSEEDKQPAETINWQKLMDYWNNTAGKVCGRIQNMTDFRKNHIRKRIDEYGKDKFIEVISLVQQSEFLTGGNDKGWRADFDWVIRPTNFIKVLEGKYNNQKPNYNNGQINSRGHPSPYANLSARLDSILAGKTN